MIEELETQKEALTNKVKVLDESLKLYIDKQAQDNANFINSLRNYHSNPSPSDHNQVLPQCAAAALTSPMEFGGLHGVDELDSSLTQSLSAQSMSDNMPPCTEKQISLGSDLRNDLINMTNQIMEINERRVSGSPEQSGAAKSKPSRTNLVLCALKSMQLGDINE